MSILLGEEILITQIHKTLPSALTDVALQLIVTSRLLLLHFFLGPIFLRFSPARFDFLSYIHTLGSSLLSLNALIVLGGEK